MYEYTLWFPIVMQGNTYFRLLLPRGCSETTFGNSLTYRSRGFPNFLKGNFFAIDAQLRNNSALVFILPLFPK